MKIKCDLKASPPPLSGLTRPEIDNAAAPPQVLLDALPPPARPHAWWQRLALGFFGFASLLSFSRQSAAVPEPPETSMHMTVDDNVADTGPIDLTATAVVTTRTEIACTGFSAAERAACIEAVAGLPGTQDAEVSEEGDDDTLITLAFGLAGVTVTALGVVLAAIINARSNERIKQMDLAKPPEDQDPAATMTVKIKLDGQSYTFTATGQQEMAELWRRIENAFAGGRR